MHFQSVRIAYMHNLHSNTKTGTTRITNHTKITNLSSKVVMNISDPIYLVSIKARLLASMHLGGLWLAMGHSACKSGKNGIDSST